MRQLHIVGLTSDHDGLILAGRRGAKNGNFVIKLDDDLLEQIEEARLARIDDLPAAPAAPPPPPRQRVESALSPREMQMRLRGGRTVAQVAAEAGVDIEWVERFAAPVLAEQAAAIGRAQELVLHTPRRGQSDRPLAPSIRRNLADRGILLLEEEFDSAWSAFQLGDSEWIIRFRYHARGRDQQAEYLLETVAGSLIPNNRLGTELGYVDPGRHAPAVRELPPMRVRSSKTGPAKKTVAEKAAVKKSAARKTVAKKRATPAKKSAPPRKVARPATRRPAKSSSSSKKRLPAKTARAASKAASGKAATRKVVPSKRTAGARKSAATRKAPVTKKAARAKKASPTRKAAGAKRAGRPRKATSAKRAGISPNVPRVRPLRAHRVETGGARNGSTHGVRALQLRAAR